MITTANDKMWNWNYAEYPADMSWQLYTLSECLDRIKNRRDQKQDCVVFRHDWGTYHSTQYSLKEAKRFLKLSQL
jgi:hypothetical protein